MLMKLFATKIVANNFFGDFKSFEIVLVDFKLSLSNESICDLVRENNATSAPDIKAEQNSIKKSNITDSNIVVVSVSNLNV